MTNRAIKGNGRKHRELPDDDDDEDGESYTDDSGTMPCPVGYRARYPVASKRFSITRPLFRFFISLIARA